MSKRKHELNNLLTNLRLGQEILSDYLASFKRVVDAMEPALKGKQAWEDEGMEQKRKEAEDVRKSAASALDKLERYLMSDLD